MDSNAHVVAMTFPRGGVSRGVSDHRVRGDGVVQSMDLGLPTEREHRWN